MLNKLPFNHFDSTPVMVSRVAKRHEESCVSLGNCIRSRHAFDAEGECVNCKKVKES